MHADNCASRLHTSIMQIWHQCSGKAEIIDITLPQRVEVLDLGQQQLYAAKQYDPPCQCRLAVVLIKAVRAFCVTVAVAIVDCLQTGGTTVYCCMHPQVAKRTCFTMITDSRKCLMATNQKLLMCTSLGCLCQDICSECATLQLHVRHKHVNICPLK